LLSQLSPEQIFDALAISVNGPGAWDLDLAVDISFTDLGSNYRLTLRNGVLVHRKTTADPQTAGVTLTLAAKVRILALMAGDATSAGLEITGDPHVLEQLVGVLDKPDPSFNIITP
jgi:alkyl sulfatase BDS1-like metallo-beta-lactamase superfamily hydrolase